MMETAWAVLFTSLRLENGADQVFLDDGKIAVQVKRSGIVFNKILEMSGVATIRDSLQCVEGGGIFM